MQITVKARQISKAKARVPLREQYLQQKERIKHEIGDLEQIRIALGCSQRSMCQMLLVDPSAWTRWGQSPSGAPPHIYQALKWLVELRKINPDAAAPSNMSQRLDFIHSTTQSKLKELESSVALLERSMALTAAVRSTSLAEPTDIRFEREISDLKDKLNLLLNKKQSVNKKRRATKRRTKTKKSPIKKRALARNPRGIKRRKSRAKAKK